MQNLMRVMSWAIVVVSVVALIHTGSGAFRLDWLLADIDDFQVVGTAGGEGRKGAGSSLGGRRTGACGTDAEGSSHKSADAPEAAADSSAGTAHAERSGGGPECGKQELVSK